MILANVKLAARARGFINVESSFESSFELLEFILDETFLE